MSTRKNAHNIHLNKYVLQHGRIHIEVNEDLKRLICGNATRFSNAIDYHRQRVISIMVPYL